MTPAPEFSRVVRLTELPFGRSEHALEASPGEREALARRLGVVAIESLDAELETRHRKGFVSVNGRFSAQVVQECVVTLEPFASRVEDEVSATFASGAAIENEVVLDVEEEDAPEPLEDGRIDLGELVAQSLSVALDPYPRRPGVTVEDAEGWEPPEERPNPFAKLEQLRPRPK